MAEQESFFLFVNFHNDYVDSRGSNDGCQYRRHSYKPIALYTQKEGPLGETWQRVRCDFEPINVDKGFLLATFVEEKIKPGIFISNKFKALNVFKNKEDAEMALSCYLDRNKCNYETAPGVYELIIRS